MNGTSTCKSVPNGASTLQSVPDEQVVALAGAVLLGRYRGTIAASGEPLKTSLEVLDEQLPEYVAQVRTWVAVGTRS